MISCSENWLAEKPDLALVIPSTLEDFQALLDNDPVMNEARPGLGEEGSDNHFVTANIWNTLTEPSKSIYIWSEHPYDDIITVQYWNFVYRQVFYSNIVLEGVEQMRGQAAYDQDMFNNIKGSALFFRAEGFFSIAQIFSKQYIKSSATTDLGIPLKLSSDINSTSSRSTVQETYDRILMDLLNASTLLPVRPAFKTRPSKPAAFALIARTYLIMGDYERSLLYADSCLNLYNTIIDYNDLNMSSIKPIPSRNDEIIFDARLVNSIFNGNNFFVDSVLFHAYHEDDLRKQAFFRDYGLGGQNFIGSYSERGYSFGGIATNEVYLMRAECHARLNHFSEAAADLNALLENRWQEGTFSPYELTSSEALKVILDERRKELLFRGLRWVDLRRLNSDSNYAVTLKRVLGNDIYTLPPNDPRYVLPIPSDVIAYSGMPQNER